VWNCVTPPAPWCPEEWQPHLDAIAPGLFADGTQAAPVEATGSTLIALPWRLLLASRRGRLHAHRGDHREDAGHLAAFDDGWCTAVADGAGSAAYSRLGSAIATAVATNVVREQLSASGAATGMPAGDTPAAERLATVLRMAAQTVNASQREFAQRAGLALRELRTTLLVAAWYRDHVGVMQVGDGAMALLHTSGAVSHPHTAATGDYSGEVAHFLPDDGALEVLLASVRTIPAADVCGVLLASDGVEDPWYPFTRFARPLLRSLLHGHADPTGAPNGEPDSEPGPAALVPARPDSVLRAADPVEALGEWLAFEKRGENDDRTLSLAYTDALLAMPRAMPRAMPIAAPPA
jgi:hypothetical protein